MGSWCLKQGQASQIPTRLFYGREESEGPKSKSPQLNAALKTLLLGRDAELPVSIFVKQEEPCQPQRSQKPGCVCRAGGSPGHAGLPQHPLT